MSAANPQLDLDFTERRWGGAREGAGRKKKKLKHDPVHGSRDTHVARNPVHVVLRTLREVPNLRRDEAHAELVKTLAKIGERGDVFRIVHISVQSNHVHLIVEAANSAALSSGMRAFAISFARGVNRAFKRKGKVWAFRYHTTTLTSPTQVRNAVVYVLNNWRRHDEDETDFRLLTAKLDPYSSAISFTGWSDWRLTAWPRNYVALPVAGARTWMLSKGWEKAPKPIRTWEVPGRLE